MYACAACAFCCRLTVIGRLTLIGRFTGSSRTFCIWFVARNASIDNGERPMVWPWILSCKDPIRDLWSPYWLLELKQALKHQSAKVDENSRQRSPRAVGEQITDSLKCIPIGYRQTLSSLSTNTTILFSTGTIDSIPNPTSRKWLSTRRQSLLVRMN